MHPARTSTNLSLTIPKGNRLTGTCQDRPGAIHLQSIALIYDRPTHTKDRPAKGKGPPGPVKRHGAPSPAGKRPRRLPAPAVRRPASRHLVKELWDLLPPEQDAIQFNDVQQQTRTGLENLAIQNIEQPVTLHLGWDVLAFSCTLEAAWFSWEFFAHIDTETWNCCIYPEDLGWFVVRAGSGLYPMVWKGNAFGISRDRGTS